MSANNQKSFLNTLKHSLADVIPNRNNNTARLFPRKPDNCQERLNAYINRNHEERLKLLEVLQASGAPIYLKVIPVPTPADARDSILNLIREKSPEWGTQKKVTAWSHPLIESLNLQSGLDKLGVPLIFTDTEHLLPDQDDRAELRKNIIESFIGITSADYCVAQTATLTMKTRPKQARSVSLVPLIHVAVIRLEQIVENLTELYFRLQWDPKEQEEGLTNCMTFISGPSKTGDIEMVIVHGAHGPRELYLYVIIE